MALTGHVELLEDVMDLALRCRHRVAAGEIGLWLARAGRLTDTPEGAFEPFARWIVGDHLGAASAFRSLGCPYEAASALADAGDAGSWRQAFTTFDRLGAVPMAELMASRLRTAGVRVPRRAVRPIAPKLGVTTRTEAAAEAVRRGVLET